MVLVKRDQPVITGRPNWYELVRDRPQVQLISVQIPATWSLVGGCLLCAYLAPPGTGTGDLLGRLSESHGGPSTGQWFAPSPASTPGSRPWVFIPGTYPFLENCLLRCLCSPLAHWLPTHGSLSPSTWLGAQNLDQGVQLRAVTSVQVIAVAAAADTDIVIVGTSYMCDLEKR